MRNSCGRFAEYDANTKTWQQILNSNRACMSREELWSDDVLARREDVIYLQKYIVNRYRKKKMEPGFVMAINADWGYGKSFMLNRWKTQAELEGHATIFFDAWQSDFTTDPLLAFIAELDTGLQNYFSTLPVGPKLSKAAINIFKKSWKPALMVLGAAALKHGAGMTLSQLSTSAGDDSPDESRSKKLDSAELQKNLKAAIEKALQAHTSIKESIVEFKGKLGELIVAFERSGGVQLPMIIFIDELDRCRPDYAIELLEGIKHLFGVPGVFFVIATNVKQLGESVKAVYGSGFEGEKYLKRFFDLQYSLREPDTGQFAASIFANESLPTLDNIIYGLEQFQSMRQQAIVEHVPVKIFSFILRKNADAFGLSLRDMLQVSTIIESSLISLNFIRVHPFFLIFLAVIFHKDRGLFLQIDRSRSLPSSERLIEAGYQPVAAKIEFCVYDDNGSRKKKVVDLAEIAKFYLTMFDETSRDQIVRSGENIFPRSLVDRSSGRDINGTYKLEFSDYFSLVQHAGSFSA